LVRVSNGHIKTIISKY